MTIDEIIEEARARSVDILKYVSPDFTIKLLAARVYGLETLVSKGFARAGQPGREPKPKPPVVT